MAIFRLGAGESVIYTVSVLVKDICGSVVRERTFLLHELSASLRITSHRLVLSPETAAKDNAIWWKWEDVDEIFLHNQKGWYVFQPECAAVRFGNGDAILFENNDAFFSYKQDALLLLQRIESAWGRALAKEPLPVQDTVTTQVISQSVSVINSSEKPSDLITTASSIKNGGINVVAGETPKFRPSAASIPKGFESAGSHEADLRVCLTSNVLEIQSFFNDLNIFGSQNSIFVNDDVLSLPCFDESLYCNIVKQMHKYTLAELADKKDQLAKENAGLGAMVGSFVGLLTINPLAPFLGHSVGKNLTDQGTKISQLLPDPHLLFYEDLNSYLAWSRGQVSSPKLRRLILDRQTNPDGTVFFRAIPAFVTADSVFPIQLFKSGDLTYFYRPFSAGIERNQSNYDAIKIQRKYFHTRLGGEISRSDIMISIRGSDVEPSEQNVYRFTGPSLDYFYIDFQIQPGFVF